MIVLNKEYKAKVKKVNDYLNADKFEEAYNELVQLCDQLVPNEKDVYLSLLSLKEDIDNNKEKSLIVNEAKIIIKGLSQLGLTKSEKWKNFIMAIFSYSLIPFIPYITSTVNDLALTRSEIILTFGLYCMSIGLSMKTNYYRIISMILSALVLSLNNNKPTDMAFNISLIISALIFILHLVDRVDRHLINNEKYL